MNRKEFLVQLTGYGAATAGIGSLIGMAPCCSAAETLAKVEEEPAEGTRSASAWPSRRPGRNA